MDKLWSWYIITALISAIIATGAAMLVKLT